MDLEENWFDITNETLTLRDRLLEPTFSVIDTRQGFWQRRKNKWKELGIKSEVGRNTTGKNTLNDLKNNPRKSESSFKILNAGETVSIFDPALVELMLLWFCVEKGNVLDPFAGGSVRGIVSNYLGYNYTGIELREEQVLNNRIQANDILKENNLPIWIIGDSDKELDNLKSLEYDFLFSCPPYHDLEVYSNEKEDLSNMNYSDFLIKYKSIIKKSYRLLKNNSFACFVVSEIRDKKGNYKGFVPDTINAFKEAGFYYYNEGILLNSVASASLRAMNTWKNKKLTRVHQNILIFKKEE